MAATRVPWVISCDAGAVSAAEAMVAAEEEAVVVGAAGVYEARCRRCFDPGVSKQETLDFGRPVLPGGRVHPDAT